MTELPGTGLPLLEFDGPEVSDFGLFAPNLTQAQIDTNAIWMRQRRQKRAEGDMLGEMSQRLYGDPNKWAEPPADASVSDRINYGFDVGAARMFADLDRFRATTPGDFANYPTSLDDLRARAAAQVGVEMAEEEQEAINKIENRSDPTLLGGAVSFAGQAVGYTADVEGLATLPLSAGSGSLARVILLNSAIGGISTIVDLPSRNAQADFLGRERPDPVAEVLMGMGFGAALPLAGRAIRISANTLTPAGRIENRELLRWGTREGATAEERGAASVLAREEASRDTAPEGVNPDEHAARIDNAERDLEDDTIRADDVIPEVGKKAGTPGASVKVEFDMGPARPLPPNQPVLDVITAAVEDTLGPGARVVVTSGQEGNLPQHGSNRHKTGDAADIAVYDADGNQITMATHPDLMREIARNASRRGAKGIGLGADYMGGSHLHIDLVEPGPGQSNAWGGEGAAMREELASLQGTGEAVATATSPTIQRPVIEDGLVAPEEWAPISNGIFAGESGGDYDALFAYSNRPGGPFEDVKLTEMTVDEALAFSDPSGPYGQWVARNRPDPENGVATPMGAYQIVHTTLAAAKEGLGLTGDEVMTPELQEKLGQWIYLEQGTGAWQGYRGPRDGYTARGPGRYTGGGMVPLGEDAAAAGLYTFDPRTLGVDAATYQFKMGGDEFGVTGRLAGERMWDPNAGVGIMAHERLDGSLWVVDGHQRSGLARRLMDEGHAPISLTGTLYRESDGFSAEQVRAMAAMKNIRQESGSPLDAAKVLRDDPSLFATVGSRSRSFMLQAQGLADLAPGPFQAIVNDVIPQNYGAIVGRVIPNDDKLQGVAIATLAKAKPANETQAESMIRDIRRLGMEKRADEAQLDMFGAGFSLRDTVISERAQVIDRIMKDARADRALFKRVEQQFDTLQEAGNVLNRTENATRAEIADQLLARFLILAEQDGPVRDAIDAAARAIRGGTKVGDAADEVFALLGRRADDDAGRGVADGAVGGGRADEDIPAPRLTELPPDGGGRIEPGLFDDPLEDVAETARIEGLERDLFAALNDPTFDLPIPRPDDEGGGTTSLRAFAEAAREETEFVDTLKTLCMTRGARP